MATARSRFPTSPVVAAGLIGGYSLARATGVRPVGGAMLAACGVLAGREWAAASVGRCAALGALYVGAFGGSHPLAKRLGAWPAVLSVTAVASAITWVVHDRRV